MTAGGLRRRAAPVEVHRVAAAEREHEVGELLERQPGVDARAAAVARDEVEVPVGDADRGARMAAVGDVGVELTGGGGEALVVRRAVEDDAAGGDEQGAGLDGMAAG